MPPAESAKRKRIVAQSGDVFAFSLSKGRFGFGRVLLNVFQLCKLGAMQIRESTDAELLVELRRIAKPDASISAEEFLATPALHSEYWFDKEIRTGVLPIVAYAPVSPDSIDFPESFLHSDESVFLCKGDIQAPITAPKGLAKRLGDQENWPDAHHTHTEIYSLTGITPTPLPNTSWGVYQPHFEAMLRGKREWIQPGDDLRVHPDRAKVWKMAALDPARSYDDLAKERGVATRAELLTVNLKAKIAKR